MALPNPNPSANTATNPYFQDNNFAKGVEMRNNNIAVWGNFDYLNWNILSNKATPVDADLFGVADSTASLAYKNTTWAQIKATLKTYFDTLYVSVSSLTSPVAWTPTFTGLGTVTGITAYSWRVGSLLHYEVTFTVGTPTATEARMSLGFNGVDGSVTTASTYPSLTVGGLAITTDLTYPTTTTIIESSKTYLTWGAFAAGVRGGLGKVNGSALFSPGVSVSVSGSVRIQGW